MDEKGVHILKSGKILNNRYVIEKVLGEGGFGITYKGIDKLLAVEVAVKEYFPQGFVTRNNVYSEEITITQMKYEDLFQKGKERFLSEARVLAKFNKESGIVSVTDFFEENNTAYIVMEYLDGITLKDYIENNGLLSMDDTLGLMSPLMEALDAVHKEGLIHRDISPDNIMLLSNGGIKLMDFGAARTYTEFGQKSLSIMLKHGYAPEEQYRTHGVQGPWTDIYALSATIYKCITGQTPVESLQRVLSDTLQSPSQMGIQIQPWQEYALMKGLSVRQENRYQNMREYCQDLYGDGSNLNYQNLQQNKYTSETVAYNNYITGNNNNGYVNTGSTPNNNTYYTSGGNQKGDMTYHEGAPAKSSNDMAVKILLGLSCVVILGIGMLFWQVLKKNNSQMTASVSTIQEKTQQDDSSTTQATATTSSTEAEATTETTEEVIEQQDEIKTNALPNVDNVSINIEACLTPSSYNVLTSADKSFSFGYPKYMFNYSESDDASNSYTLTYEGGDEWLELNVYEEDNPGDPVANARKLYDKYVSQSYATYFSKEPKEVDSTGMARALIGGLADASGTTGSYIIAANDGKKNYILEFYYPDPDINYDYDDINYVVDCVYRYCSFSGGSYKPRTYQQFLKDDMGTKK